MSLSKNDLDMIHTRKLAIKNKKYYRQDGIIFIGLSNGRLSVFNNIEVKSNINLSDKIKELTNRLNSNPIIKGEDNILWSISIDKEGGFIKTEL